VAAAAAVTLDLGTGDGHFPVARAAVHPEELVIGVDASRSAMVESSRRAARRTASGSAANPLFVVSAAGALPAELAASVDLLTVHFPWGSLLRGVVGHDPELTATLAGLVAPGGRARLLISVAGRDARGGLTEIDLRAVAEAWRFHGLQAESVRPATLADANEARSSWGRRLLRVPAADRRAWKLELRRCGTGIIGP
jgi:16S rRNA (adenine(1408)-N(1))-methyltransferase